MSIAEQEARFTLLVMAVVEATATAEELSEFRELMRAHPEFKLQYLEQMKIHGLMSYRQEMRNAGAGRCFRRPSVVGQLHVWWKVAAGLVAAVLIAVLSGVAVNVSRPSKTVVLATIETVCGEVSVISGGETSKALEGRQLYSGDELSVSGSSGAACVVWEDGSRLMLPAVSRVVLSRSKGEKRITLLAGAFDATFSKQLPGESYMIVTPDGRAKVLGTTVTVIRGLRGTEFSVVQGQVRVERFIDGAKTDVSSRHEVLLSAQENSGKLSQTRFYWSDRFSGGPKAGAATKQFSGKVIGNNTHRETK